MENRLIGLILISLGLAVFIGCWWGVWDLLNSVRYWVRPEFYMEFRFYSPYHLLYVDGNNYTNAFDVFSWLAIIACITVGIGGYLIGFKIKETENNG